MVRTAVGYCGGTASGPSYHAVCSNPLFEDYAEAVHIDYDPLVLSYDDVLTAFFRMHDATARGRSRQYASIIFTHGEEQRRAAEAKLATQPRAWTSIEQAAPFWDAEAYHQKWLLQRKRDLFMAVGMAAPDELWGKPATVLNACAGGKLPGSVALRRLDALVESDEFSPEAYDAVARELARLGW